MHTLEQTKQRAADPRSTGPSRLHWLAFLLSGRSGSSADVALDAIESPDGANPSFSTWLVAWSRRLNIAKALAPIRAELAASARRTRKRSEEVASPPRNWALDGDTTRVQFERALLAIDVFPRCVLLLSVFEKLSLEDTAVLLDGERDLVRKARIIGLRELTRNLARMQTWTSTDTRSNVATSEMQHA
jgi:DNA-directed RNA polymerase specialized sigma24 family protein